MKLTNQQVRRAGEFEKGAWSGVPQLATNYGEDRSTSVSEDTLPQYAGYEPGCSVAAVPFGRSDPDPDSDVIALFSIKTNRFACLNCLLTRRSSLG